MRLIFALFIVLLSGNAFTATLSGKVYDFALDELNDSVIDVNSVPLQRVVSKNGEYSFELSPGVYNLTANFYSNSNGSISLTADENIVISNEGEFVFDLILSPLLEEAPEFESFDDFSEKTFEDEPEIKENKITEIGEAETIKPEKEFDFTFYGIAVAVIAVIALIAGIIFLIKGKSNKDQKEIEPRISSASDDFDKTEEVIEEELKKAIEARNETKNELKQEEKKETKNELHLDKYAKEVIEILKRNGNRLTQLELRDKINLGEAKVSLIVSELESLGLVKKIKKGRGNIIILKPQPKTE